MQKNNTDNKNGSGQNKRIIIILSLITLTAVGITVWALFFRRPAASSSADYAPRQVESNAETITGESEPSLEAPKGGGAVSLTYSDAVTISLSAREAAILFQNPAKSNQDIKLQLIIDSRVIAESGRLPAGYKLEKLSGVDTDKLAAGTYRGKYTVSYYDTTTGEKAILSTEIPVTITVRE